MTWTRRRLLASVACVCSISGCLGSASDSGRSLPEDPAGTWNQSGYDVQNTRTADVSVPDRGTPAWSGGSGSITPLVVDGTVYTVDDTLTALDAQTGERRWQTDLDVADSPGSATQPAVAGRHLLLAADGRIASFDTADGSERWERTVTGSPDQPITVATDRQIGFTFFERPGESASPSELVAFATESGDIEWTASLRSLVTPPAVFGGHVYAVGWAGPETRVLRCLGMDDGKLVWEQEVDARDSRVIGTDMGVLVGGGADITVYGHSDGKRLASVSVPHEQIRAIAIDDGTAFVLAESGLSAVSVPDGETRWSLSGVEYAQADGLAVGRDTVVAPVFADPDSLNPSIAAFRKADGASQWYYTVDEAFTPRIVTPPVLADRAVFVTSNTKTGVTALGNLPPRTDETASS